jgi:hypothetical protein
MLILLLFRNTSVRYVPDLLAHLKVSGNTENYSMTWEMTSMPVRIVREGEKL